MMQGQGPQGGRGGMPPMMMMQGGPMPAGGRGGPGFRGGMPTGGRGGPGGRGGMPPQQMGAAGGNPNMRFNNQARNQPAGAVPGQMGMPMQQQQPQQVPQQQAPLNLDTPLDDQMLAAADPQTQKNLIGERLYPLIMRQQPEFAGKITGMLLEMDNAELLHLIDTPDALTAKIEEALDVLKKHMTGADM